MGARGAYVTWTMNHQSRDGLASDENLDICDASVKHHAKQTAVARIIAECARRQLEQVSIPSQLGNRRNNRLRDILGDLGFDHLCAAIAGGAAGILCEEREEQSDGVPIAAADPGSTDVTQDVKIDTGSVPR